MGGGGGATPKNGLYRFVRPQIIWVWVLGSGPHTPTLFFGGTPPPPPGLVYCSLYCYHAVEPSHETNTSTGCCVIHGLLHNFWPQLTQSISAQHTHFTTRLRPLPCPYRHIKFPIEIFTYDRTEIITTPKRIPAVKYFASKLNMKIHPVIPFQQM